MTVSGTEIAIAGALFVGVPLLCAGFVFWLARRPVTVHVREGDRVTTVVDGEIIDTWTTTLEDPRQPAASPPPGVRDRVSGWRARAGARGRAARHRLDDWRLSRRFQQLFSDEDRRDLAAAWDTALAEPTVPIVDTVIRLCDEQAPICSVQPPRQADPEVTLVFADGTTLRVTVADRHAARLIANQLWHGAVKLVGSDVGTTGTGTLWFTASDGELPLPIREIRR
jgi:hypothetical protein